MSSVRDLTIGLWLVITPIILLITIKVRNKIQLPNLLISFLTKIYKDKIRRRLNRLYLKDLLPTTLLLFSISAFSICTLPLAGLVATGLLACFKRLNFITALITCVIIIPQMAYYPMDAGNGMAGLLFTGCFICWIIGGAIVNLIYTLIEHFNKQEITKMRLQKKQQLKEDNQRLSSQPDNSI